MKPSKNRVMCPDCGRTKMLFDTQKSADNFIKFNGHEIIDDPSRLRSYYCDACGGYHITKAKFAPSVNRTEKLISAWKGDKTTNMNSPVNYFKVIDNIKELIDNNGGRFVFKNDKGKLKIKRFERVSGGIHVFDKYGVDLGTLSAILDQSKASTYYQMMLQEVGSGDKTMNESESYSRNRLNTPDDEFYTRYEDCVKEYSNYDFRGKTVYCNCDNPEFSQIYRYFYDNFEKLGLKKLYDSYFVDGEITDATEYDGTRSKVLFSKMNCSFDCPECVNLAKQSDIVVSNPPFGKQLARRFVNLMLELNVDFIAVMPYTIVQKPEIINAYMDGRLCSGYTYVHNFIGPDGSKKTAPVYWMSTVNNHNRPDIRRAPREQVVLSDEGEKMVRAYRFIPEQFDYDLLLPITYIAYFDPDKYKILGFKYFHYEGQKKCGLIIRQR